MPIRFTDKFAFGGETPPIIMGAKKANAQKMGEALTKVQDEHNGRLRPRDVWQAARDPRNALHRHFQWNKDRAAEKYWDQQARAIIHWIVRVPENEDEPPRRAFLSIMDNGRTYRSINEVMDSLDLQLQLRKEGLRGLTAWKNRFNELEEICRLVGVAEGALAADIASRAKAKPKGKGPGRPRGRPRKYQEEARA